LKVGEPADVLVVDLDRLDRDAIMPVAPIDLLFSRASAAHVVALHIAGRAVVADGRLTGVDLDDVQAKLRQQYRERIATREPFLAAWERLEPAAVAFYRGQFGCC
jgi:cytosine/adenosine deaminase-related metal-dependent hydrolase